MVQVPALGKLASPAKKNFEKPKLDQVMMFKTYKPHVYDCNVDKVIEKYFVNHVNF